MTIVKTTQLNILKKLSSIQKQVKKLGKFTYYNGWIDGHPIRYVILDKHFHTNKWNYDIINKIK